MVLQTPVGYSKKQQTYIQGEERGGVEVGWYSGGVGVGVVVGLV